MMKAYNYRPLPKEVTIKPSSIDGLGLFATEKIAQNTNLGVAWVSLPRDTKQLKELFERDEAVEWCKENDMWIRTPLGGFPNHSTNPNCAEGYMGGFVNLVTIKDIEIGEELTTNYLKSQGIGISVTIDENGNAVFPK